MRPVILALTFTLGALAMSDTATIGDDKEEKKEDKKSPAKKESYDEKVTIRPWDGKEFKKPIEGVLAYRKVDKDGVTRFWTWPVPATTGNPSKGAEIIDKDGVVWVVEVTEKGSTAFVSTVKKKPKE